MYPHLGLSYTYMDCIYALKLEQPNNSKLTGGLWQEKVNKGAF